MNINMKGVMEPSSVLSRSMPKMKMIPEIWPASTRSPWEVASGAGKVISLPYWYPMGPAAMKKKPKTKLETSSSQ